MKRWIFLSLLFLAPFLEAAEAIVFYAILSPGQVVHKMYHPGEENVPHYFYEKQCKTSAARHPTHAIGSATFIYYPDTHALHYAISYTGLSSIPLMMHIHIGFTGETGPVLQTIFGRPYEKPKAIGWLEDKAEGTMAPKGLSGFVSGTYVLSAASHLEPTLSVEEVVQALLRGGIYVNIHTCLNQKGEVRGQILPLSFPQ